MDDGHWCAAHSSQPGQPAGEPGIDHPKVPRLGNLELLPPLGRPRTEWCATTSTPDAARFAVSGLRQDCENGQGEKSCLRPSRRHITTTRWSSAYIVSSSFVASCCFCRFPDRASSGCHVQRSCHPCPDCRVRPREPGCTSRGMPDRYSSGAEVTMQTSFT